MIKMTFPEESIMTDTMFCIDELAHHGDQFVKDEGFLICFMRIKNSKIKKKGVESMAQYTVHTVIIQYFQLTDVILHLIIFTHSAASVVVCVQDRQKSTENAF